MKLFCCILFAFFSFKIYAEQTTISTEEETLINKGFAVVCVHAMGVLNSDHLGKDLNKKLQMIKTKATISAPALSLALINVIDQKTTDPGAMATLCVSLTKKN